MFFHIVVVCIRKEKKTVLLLNDSVFREYNQVSDVVLLL